MKTFLRFVLLTLILVSVAMLSALAAMRLAIHGREVAVPKLTGMAHGQAESEANASGLIVEVANHFYSSEIGEGKVVSQSPAAGSLVRRGWTVRVAESLGPQRAQVPNLVGQSVRAAEINVRQRGLEVGSVAVGAIPGESGDQIVAQSPQPESGFVESPKISVLMAAEELPREFVMPSFVGKRLAEIRQQIEDAGFTVGRVVDLTAPPAPQAAGKPNPAALDSGIIFKQAPAAGQKIVAGASISFEVTH